MAKLYQNSLEGFLYEGLKDCEIHLLIDGPLQGLATWRNTTETWDWPTTGSWYHSQNRVDRQGNWTGSVNNVVANNGTLQGGYLVGLAISAKPVSGGKDTLTALEMADRLKMSVDFGTNHQNFNIKVTNKRLENGFVYLDIEKVPITPELGAAIGIYFKYYENNTHYWGYTCYPRNNNEVTISLYPYTPPVESEEYNPVTNNVIADRQGTIARLVEEFELRNTLVGSLEDAENIYDGWFAGWNSATQASQSLDGSSSYGTRPTAGGVTANAGGATGIYQLLPLAYVEKATTFADIADSFYSSIANISGRWLGTKNAEYHTYLGDKLWFTNRNMTECKKDIQQNVDKGMYLVYQDSPCVFHNVGDDKLKANVSGSIRGTVESGSLISGSLDGLLDGKISGIVTKVDVVNQVITYCSNSVNVKNHELWTEVSPVSIQGTGTIAHSSWAKVQSGSATNVLQSDIRLEGLTKFNGRCNFPEYTSSYQTFVSEFDTVSGSIKSWGRIQGIGQVNYVVSTGSFVLNNTAVTQTAGEVVAEAAVDLHGSVVGSEQSQQFTDYNHLYLKNINFSKLQVGSVLSGSLQIIPTGSVYISGTLGASEKTLTLHTFNGTLDVRNNSNQSFEFEHADTDGVLLNNVEIARQSNTIFDAFTADSITVASDFGGQIGIDITGGKVNVSSDGNIYVSVAVENQEDNIGTGSNATGSLPDAVRKFMGSGSVGVPAWDFSKVRKSIVGKVVGGNVQEQDLAEGTIILSGSLSNFEIRGTRKALKPLKYVKMYGTRVPASDIQQSVTLLADLEAGVAFAEAAYARSGSDGFVTSSVVTPKTLTNAIMPQKVYDAMEMASKYTVPGTTGPVWPASGSVPSGSVARKFNFYSKNASDRVRIQNFISGSKKAIASLETYLSGSLVIDNQFKNQAGQYTYVYLQSSVPEYLNVNVVDFSGSYISTGSTEVVFHTGSLKGSYSQVWGRFGEGRIASEGPSELKIATPLKSSSIFEYERMYPSTYGVVYGAFNYRGYLNGGFEGNEVDGILEGDMSGLFKGIVSNGNIIGGPVQMQGTSRGAFKGNVTAGTFNGAVKDLIVSGNNLTNNLVLEGQINNTEEFPLQGILSGSVQNISLPGRCSYEMTGSAFDNQQIDLHIPKKGFMTGKLEMPAKEPGVRENVLVSGTKWWSQETGSGPAPATGSDHSMLPDLEGEYKLYSGSVIVVEIFNNLDSKEIYVEDWIRTQGWDAISNVSVERWPEEDQWAPVGITIARVKTYGLDSMQSVGIPTSSFFALQRGTDWSDQPLNLTTTLNLTGDSVKVNGSFPGEISGSVIFGTDGKLVAAKRATSNWSASIATDWSKLSGQFEISGSGILLNTPENSPFSGKISPITVNQNVTGSFDIAIEDSTYLDLRMNGRLENFNGHVLVQGLVDIESGSKGNLVEGHDRPFFTLQTFSGSIFPEDTTLEAVENMSISDMVMDNLRFTSGMAFVEYSTGSFGIIKEHEYVRNTLTLPQIGDVVYMGAGNQARVVSAKLYCPDLNALLTVNDRGTVVREEYLTQIQ